MSESMGYYSVAVVDIGSPKLGNIGWCVRDAHDGKMHTGSDLDALFPHIAQATRYQGLILGLEAPLFVPIRPNLLQATQGRKGEGRRPWSAGAGAQVLALNLPLMVYIFQAIQRLVPDMHYALNGDHFHAQPQQIMLFEALVSGSDKGNSHIEDACIMVESCWHFSQQQQLPVSILEHEDEVGFFNLAAAALMRCGMVQDAAALHEVMPIYKPSNA